MKLPRRVPWTSIGELEQVCTWIYADDSDAASKTLAVNRLSAWKAITALPHALESTLALLTVIIQDNSLDPSSSSSCLSLRHSYAAGIIRLVNGLVDPLQLGAYARSISSIAQQLGLPLWLVELRHAATHEDLPSLELLRDAARESMKWLLHNYFLPTLNPSTTPRLEAILRPLTPILTRYKKLLKLTTRDASLHAHFGTAINGLLREVERWVAEAKVAASLEGFGWGGGSTVENGDHDMKEKWALDKLCDALLENGVLVPVSKKKRIYPEESFSPPQFSVVLWSPLLTHIQSHHPDLRSALVHRIVSRLLLGTSPSLERLTDRPRSTAEHMPPDPSFEMCLSRWAWWILNVWAVDPANPDYDLRKDIIETLFTALGPSAARPAGGRKAARDLLNALCKADPDLEAALATLLPQTGNSMPPQWTEGDMTILDERLNALLPQDLYMQSPEANFPLYLPSPSSPDLALPQGWRLLDSNSQWRACPIGVYVGAEMIPMGAM